jgi:hypothetical protein
MPEISRFFGIVIRMFYNDHAPPHFHSEYGEHEALIEIESMVVYAGSLPNRALALVREWATMHRDELRQDWWLEPAGCPARSRRWSRISLWASFGSPP